MGGIKMRHRALLAIFIMATVVLLFAAGCSKESQNAAPITIGINNWAGYDPFILADQTGLFKKNHVRVEIKRFASTTDEIRAMQEGEIQGAGFTLDEVVSLVETGFKGKVVLIVDYSMGGDMVIGQKEIKSIADLAGKTIGYEGSVVGEFLLHRALNRNRVNSSAVTLVDVQAGQWISTFKEKGIDELVCFDPVASVLLNEHKGNLLFSSAAIPFEIIDVLLFSESFYNDNKASVANILRAWFDALNYMDTNPDKAAEVITSTKGIRVNNYKQSQQGLVAPGLNVNIATFDGKSDRNIFKYSQVVIDFMMFRNMLSKRVNTADLFASEALLEIQTPTDHKQMKQ